MDNIKINFIDEADADDADKEMLNNIYALSELAALDDDNLQAVYIDGIRYSGVYIKNNKLTCSKCHNPLPKLKEQLHINMDDNTDKSIYRCNCGQYIIKTYSAN